LICGSGGKIDCRAACGFLIRQKKGKEQAKKSTDQISAFVSRISGWMRKLLIVACLLLGIYFHQALRSCCLTFEWRNCSNSRTLAHWD
jgi:hypothetical protein